MTRICCLFILCMLTLVSLPAMGQVTLNETTTSVGSLRQFAYTANNVGQVPIVSLTIEVGTPVTNIIAPVGWTGGSAPFGSDTTVVWSVSDVPFELLSNTSLSGFSFVSTQTVGSVQYSAFDDNFNNFDGVTQGPIRAAVPEPSAKLMLGAMTFVSCGLFFGAWRRSQSGKRLF